jgi:hypothetical protein
MPPENLQEIYRLVKENNRMLHKMRRNAFWGGVLKFVMYGALVLVPLWLYMSYLAPIVDQALGTIESLQGTGERVGAQFGGIENLLKQFQESVQGQ